MYKMVLSGKEFTYNAGDLGIKQITNENLLYSRGNCTQYSVVTQMGRKSKKEGIYLYVWLIHIAVQLKLIQHRKAVIFQLEKKKENGEPGAIPGQLQTLRLWLHSAAQYSRWRL